MSLRPYQSEAIDSIFDYFKHNKKGNPLIVLPTGSGKTHVLGGICEYIHDRWPEEPILILSHVQEILVQDYNSMRDYLPRSKVGLYSAGLGKKQIRQFTIAGIHSVYRKPEEFNQFRLIIVDEAHLIPPSGEGMYRTFIEGLDSARVVGLTATPYRLGLGYLVDGDIFDKVVYNKDILELIEDGYLCYLTSKETSTRMNLRGVKKVAGDYSTKSLSSKLDKEAITQDIINEISTYKDIRKHWLLFAIDIAHAEHITQCLIDNGITAACVHSKMDVSRSDIVDLFKFGGFQALVSVETLTTGFDAPNVDLIALLRPTTSPVLHVQMIGRGLRLCSGKTNCLILDFAGNIPRLGPVNDVEIPTPGIKKATDEMLTKTCPQCSEILALGTVLCTSCGFEFVRVHNLNKKTSGASILSKTKTINEVKVTSVRYSKYQNGDKIPLLLLTYSCGLRTIKEWVSIEHLGFPGHKARHWMKYHGVENVPGTVDEALQRRDEISIPLRIVVDESGKYPQVKKHIY